MLLGTPALHRAASPAEDNTARTQTSTPDWYSWGTVRPFLDPTSGVGPHSRCDTWEGRWVQIGLCGSVLAPNTGTSQVPNETQSSQGSKVPTSKKRDPCTQGNTSAVVANGHHHGKRPATDSDTGRQRVLWTTVVIPEPLHLFFGCGFQRNSISDTELRTKVGTEAMTANMSQQEHSHLGFWPGQKSNNFLFSLNKMETLLF